MKSDIIEGYNRRADNHIVKPFETTLLKQKIDNSIKSRRVISKRLIHSNQQVFLKNEQDKHFTQKIA